jgi:hypothetical protein
MIPAIPDGRIENIGGRKSRLVVDITPVPEFLSKTCGCEPATASLCPSGLLETPAVTGLMVTRLMKEEPIVDETRLEIVIVCEGLHVGDSFQGSIISPFPTHLLGAWKKRQLRSRIS